MTKTIWEINKIFQFLLKKNPKPKTELKYVNNYTFLVSVVLSAQSTDLSVNQATKNLFMLVKTPSEMIALGEKNLIKYIKTIGLYNTKAKNIISLSKILINTYKEKIPKKFADLILLPGVGKKTASVYQNTILKMPRIAVDTHVFRVSNRIGLAKTKTANLTQIHLEKIVPRKWLMNAHHLLILHGRKVCKARKPLCNSCVIQQFCNYNKNQLKT